MYEIEEQILIVYSVGGTQPNDRAEAEAAIDAYTHAASNLRVKSHVFEIPAGAAPGAALGTELTRQLHSSLGAVVFVDDLRPNVVYELGFFHGRGATVLLLTRQPIDTFWLAMSDLAGFSLAQLNNTDIPTAVNQYLTRLYEDSAHVPVWRLLPAPTPQTNLLTQLPNVSRLSQFRAAGVFGGSLEIAEWDGLNIPLQLNLLSNASFEILVRSPHPDAEFTVYFHVRLADRYGDRRQVWLGLTSTRRTVLMRREERTVPMQAPAAGWCILAGTFEDLLRIGSMLGSGPVDYVDQVRFRAGRPNQSNPVAIEVGYLAIIGRDA